MSFPLPEGPSLLGRACGHAAFLYGDLAGDYDDIIAAAIGGRPGARPPAPGGYARARAGDLIAMAEGGQVGHGGMGAWEWIGAATEIMRELTRDA